MIRTEDFAYPWTWKGESYMAKKKSEQKTKRRRVTFSLEAPDARQVNLMGDFNRWHAKVHPMKRDENGLQKLKGGRATLRS